MSRKTLVARVLPLAFAGLGARRVMERNFLVSRHRWAVMLSGFFEPVFYLFAVGVGMGRLAGPVTLTDGAAVSYTAFVAPALLAASAMNGAIYESTFNVFGRLRYEKVYDAMLATPLRPTDIAVGEIGWSQLRGLVYASAFLAVMVPMGLVTSWWAVLALPAAVLIGVAFAAAAMAATTFIRSWQDFDLVQLVTLPLFLFSATFFPLGVYPEPLRPLVQLSPLYHGVALLRMLLLGTPGRGIVLHLGVLVGLALLGAAVARHRLAALLLR